MAGQKTDERDRHLGRRMAESRKRAQLTQRRVAQSFGMSAAQLQKYEKGINRVSAIHLEILSRLTGVELAAFFAGMPRLDDGPGLTEAPQARLRPEAPLADLARLLARHLNDHLGEPERRDIAHAIETLRKELGA